MRGFTSFLKKELLESKRSGRLAIVLILFFLFGVMNPAIAKLTPLLMELMSDSLADAGMTVGEVTVNAMTSWTQFFKNIPMALIAFVFIFGGSFAKEYSTGTLVLVLTKGLPRYKIVLAKAAVMLSLWSVGYWLCFGVTYGYNAYFWDNSGAVGLMSAVVDWWVFGIFTVCLMIFFSVLSDSYSGVMLGTGGVVLGSYLLGLFPKISKYLPTSLMNSSGVTSGIESAEELVPALCIAVALSVICIVTSVVVFNKKKI